MPALAEAYERLRRAATESLRHSPNLQGLGILIHRGMAAWMSACTAVTSSMPTPTTPEIGDVLHMLPSAQRDVIDLLAAMALTITPEVRT